MAIKGMIKKFLGNNDNAIKESEAVELNKTYHFSGRGYGDSMNKTDITLTETGLIINQEWYGDERSGEINETLKYEDFGDTYFKISKEYNSGSIKIYTSADVTSCGHIFIPFNINHKKSVSNMEQIVAHIKNRQSEIRQARSKELEKEAIENNPYPFDCNFDIKVPKKYQDGISSIYFDYDLENTSGERKYIITANEGYCFFGSMKTFETNTKTKLLEAIQSVR